MADYLKDLLPYYYYKSELKLLCAILVASDAASLSAALKDLLAA